MVFVKDVHLTQIQTKVKFEQGDGVLLSLLSLDMKGFGSTMKDSRFALEDYMHF